MEKNFSIKGLLTIALFAVSYCTMAELPPLKVSLPVTFPHEFSGSYDVGYIDMDGDDDRDFRVVFSTTGTGTGSSSSCYISDGSVKDALFATSGSSGNYVLSEYVSSKDDYYTSILSGGELIGSALPSGGSWQWSSCIYQNNHILPGAPLASNYTNGKHSGYIGVQYQGSGGTYFGWLNVVIDDDEPSVTINSVGHASAPGSSVLAGSGSGSAVPVSLIASILGFGLIGGGFFLKRRKKK